MKTMANTTTPCLHGDRLLWTLSGRHDGVLYREDGPSYMMKGQDNSFFSCGWNPYVWPGNKNPFSLVSVKTGKNKIHTSVRLKPYSEINLRGPVEWNCTVGFVYSIESGFAITRELFVSFYEMTFLEEYQGDPTESDIELWKSKALVAAAEYNYWKSRLTDTYLPDRF